MTLISFNTYNFPSIFDLAKWTTPCAPFPSSFRTSKSSTDVPGHILPSSEKGPILAANPDWIALDTENLTLLLRSGEDPKFRFHCCLLSSSCLSFLSVLLPILLPVFLSVLPFLSVLLIAVPPMRMRASTAPAWYECVALLLVVLPCLRSGLIVALATKSWFLPEDNLLVLGRNEEVKPLVRGRRDML